MAAGLADGVQRVARGLQHARGGNGVLALEAAVEGVDEQHRGLAAGGAASVVAASLNSAAGRVRQKVSLRQRGSDRLADSPSQRSPSALGAGQRVCERWPARARGWPCAP
jgi:hypothetical protein